MKHKQNPNELLRFECSEFWVIKVLSSTFFLAMQEEKGSLGLEAKATTLVISTLIRPSLKTTQLEGPKWWAHIN